MLKRTSFPKIVSSHNHILRIKLMKPGLFAHRKAGKLPSGEKIILLKVGGRTSAVVPSLQLKTGAVATEITEKNSVNIKAEDDGVAQKPSSAKSKKRKAT